MSEQLGLTGSGTTEVISICLAMFSQIIIVCSPMCNKVNVCVHDYSLYTARNLCKTSTLGLKNEQIKNKYHGRQTYDFLFLIWTPISETNFLKHIRQKVRFSTHLFIKNNGIFSCGLIHHSRVGGSRHQRH